MRHSEIAQAPRHRGHDVQQTVGRGRIRGNIVAGHHGQIAGKALRIGDHGIPAARHADAIDQNGHQCQRHDDGLDEVGGGHGAEAAQNRIAHDDERRDQHCGHVIHAEQAVEQLAAGRKARRRIGHEEHDDDDRAQCVQQVALVMEPQGQKLRDRDGVQIGRIAAQTPRNDEPVQPCAHGQTDGRPARRCNAGQVGQTRHSHQQPAGHIAGFGAHRCDQRSHFAAAKVKVGAVVVGFAVGKANEQHCDQIDHDGRNDANRTHDDFPLCFPRFPIRDAMILPH